MMSAVAPELVVDVKLFLDADESLICHECKNILREAVRTSPCSHIFCRACLEARLQSDSKRRQCPFPECQKQIIATTIAKDVRDEVDGQMVRCFNYHLGCAEHLEFKEVHKHWATCAYTMVSCAACKHQVKRSELDSHSKTQCVKRTVSCSHCQQPQVCDNLETHLATCTQALVVCPKGCSSVKNLERRRVPEHIANECLLQEIECPYKAVGCIVKVQRCAMNAHLTDPATTAMHLAAMLAKVDEHKSQVTQVVQRMTVLEASFKDSVHPVSVSIPKPSPTSTSGAGAHRHLSHYYINKAPRVGNVFVDDVIDVLDSQSLWLLAVVKEVKDGGMIHIHYFGWRSNWDEWINLNDNEKRRGTFYGSAWISPTERVCGGATRWSPKYKVCYSLLEELSPFLKMKEGELQQGGYICCQRTARDSAGCAP